MPMHWMFNCKKVSQKVSESMDRKLPLPERVMIGIHYLMCFYCKRLADQMKFMRRLAGSQEVENLDLDTTVELSEEAKKRLKFALKNP